MSPQNKIDGIRACVFDAYGTLFDVHSAVGKHRDRLGEKADQVSMLWRTKQLEYTWLRSLMKQHADFWKVTWDAAGASAFGFNVAWVNRFGQSKELLPGKPDFEINTLIELPDLIQ